MNYQYFLIGILTTYDEEPPINSVSTELRLRIKKQYFFDLLIKLQILINNYAIIIIIRSDTFPEVNNDNDEYEHKCLNCDIEFGQSVGILKPARDSVATVYRKVKLLTPDNNIL